MKTLYITSACLAVALLSLTGFVLASERAGKSSVFGTMVVKEANRPAGFPSPTPVGKVEIKKYPQTRSASVNAKDVDQGEMFQSLFRHIKKNKIAMTAPVIMEYGTGGTNQMEFLYASPQLGSQGVDGTVHVKDTPALTVISIGVRGNYSRERFEKHKSVLTNWLNDHHEEWVAAGNARYLGFNSPFVPGFMKYGEVQVPVTPASTDVINISSSGR